ncbi:MAG: M20/M25/M40 family metallo-hydrolase [Candidatus Melainabacteria bacterium]
MAQPTQSTSGVALDSERILTTFLEMVRINSPSGDEGLMRNYLIQRVSALGLTHQTDAGGNLIVEVPGQQATHEEILILSGHMDVVPPCLDIHPSVASVTVDGQPDKLITSDNTTVLGADDKAGLTPILEAIAHARTRGLPMPNCRLIFTTREETSLGGAKELADAALNARFAVIFDHTGRQGTIINQAPTYIRFTMDCHGKSVHAGIMPEAGVNAIVLASRIIRRMSEAGLTGRVDENTTCNIGFIEGGKATNIVPDAVTITGELRGHEETTLNDRIARIQAIAQEESAAMAGSDVTFSHRIDFHGYRLADDEPDLRRVQQACGNLGITPQCIRTNGGSDNNVFMKRGLKGVVMSAGYVEPHSLKERVKLSEMLTCTTIILEILAVFAREPQASP